MRRRLARLLYRMGFPRQAVYVLPRWTQAEVDDINRCAAEMSAEMRKHMEP